MIRRDGSYIVNNFVEYLIVPHVSSISSLTVIDLDEGEKERYKNKKS